jgi:uncharacterized membrane protein
MAVDWERRVSAWSDAGVIDTATADRIREYEVAQVAATRTRWSVWLAVLFGGVLLCAGVLLLVSASWDELSPASRLSLVVGTVVFFHAAAAAAARWSERVALVLHAVGTFALGPCIFLAGAILGLDEHWPSGVMLWALGALAALAVRRDQAHVALAALLVPAWLLCEWAALGETHDLRYSLVGQGGAFLLALAYLTTPLAGASRETRRTFGLLGTLAFLPAAVTLGVQAGLRVSPPEWLTRLGPMPAVGIVPNALAWAGALILPLAAAAFFRRRGAWLNAVAAAWVVGLALLPAGGGRMAVYGWLALGAISLGAWGVREVSTGRINLATACFALVVVFYYFDNVMGKIGRSASLIGLGVLFLAGGYILERVRRRMLERVAGGVR